MCDIRFKIKHPIGLFIFRSSRLLLKAFGTDQSKQRILTLSNIIIICSRQNIDNFLDEPNPADGHDSDEIHIGAFEFLRQMH